MAAKAEISAASAKLTLGGRGAQKAAKPAAAREVSAKGPTPAAAGTPDAPKPAGELPPGLRRIFDEGGKLMAGLVDGAGEALRKVLDITSRRQSVIAANVANKDTPGYRAKDIDFGAELRAALDKTADKVTLSATAPGHFGPPAGARAIDPQVRDREGAPFRPDGNTVDVDREMLSLSENAMAYTSALQLLSKKIALLRYAVSDGGR